MPIDSTDLFKCFALAGSLLMAGLMLHLILRTVLARFGPTAFRDGRHRIGVEQPRILPTPVSKRQ